MEYVLLWSALLDLQPLTLLYAGQLPSISPLPIQLFSTRSFLLAILPLHSALQEAPLSVPVYS